jgi:DNA repair exonuclease SbcCD ATPase subunit
MQISRPVIVLGTLAVIVLSSGLTAYLVTGPLRPSEGGAAGAADRASQVEDAPVDAAVLAVNLGQAGLDPALASLQSEEKLSAFIQEQIVRLRSLNTAAGALSSERTDRIREGAAALLGQESPTRQAEVLCDRLDVYRLPGTRFIVVRVTGGSGQMRADLANAVVDSHLAALTRERDAGYARRMASLQAVLGEDKARLHEKEMNLDMMRSTLRYADSDALASLKADGDQVRTRLRDVEQEIQQAKGNEEAIKKLEDERTGLQDQLQVLQRNLVQAGAAIDRLKGLERERDQLRTQLEDSNQKLRQLQQEIDSKTSPLTVFQVAREPSGQRG